MVSSQADEGLMMVLYCTSSASDRYGRSDGQEDQVGGIKVVWSLASMLGELCGMMWHVLTYVFAD